MLGLFGDAGESKPSLDAIRFDTTGFMAQGEPHPGRVRVWHTPQGDGLGVYFFPVPPDLPPNAASATDLVDFYRHRLGDSGGKLVECAIIMAGGCSTVWVILSLPQQPSGRIYVGSLTVPFRDFSFVIKCQAEETGPTGLKEAVLFNRSRAANEPIQIAGGRFHIPGWNPDDEKYDVEFPDHPVARTRKVLKHVAGSLVVAQALKGLPGFALPQ